jgi:hypothetical protein
MKEEFTMMGGFGNGTASLGWPKARFRCSERYLDVKRSVRRGICPPGTHTFDIWLPV